MKHIAKSFLVFFLLAAFALSLGGCAGNATKTYSTARTACEKFLLDNRERIELLAKDAAASQVTESKTVLEHTYYYGSDGYVYFSIGSQGMLGGQYWELVYTPGGSFCGETETYAFREADGNNIVKAEKLADNWWYCWRDFDGTPKSEQ